MLDRLLAVGDRDGGKPFEALVRRVSSYLSDHGASDNIPYREAILAVRKRAESAAKGNLPPAPAPEATAKAADPLAVGSVIPDVTAAGITTSASAKLSALKGKPILVAYFQPAAGSGRQVVRLLDELHRRKLGVIVPLAIGDPTDSKNLILDLKMPLSIYDGTGVYKTHGLSATPVFIVVDADGVIRHVTRGWGGETPAEVTREFERWAK
jgi:peroxiredoxin